MAPVDDRIWPVQDDDDWNDWNDGENDWDDEDGNSSEEPTAYWGGNRRSPQGGGSKDEQFQGCNFTEKKRPLQR